VITFSHSSPVHTSVYLDAVPYILLHPLYTTLRHRTIHILVDTAISPASIRRPPSRLIEFNQSTARPQSRRSDTTHNKSPLHLTSAVPLTGSSGHPTCIRGHSEAPLLLSSRASFENGSCTRTRQSLSRRIQAIAGPASRSIPVTSWSQGLQRGRSPPASPLKRHSHSARRPPAKP